MYFSLKKLIIGSFFVHIIILAVSSKRCELREETMLFLFQRVMTMLIFKIMKRFRTAQKVPKLITFLYSWIDPSLNVYFITPQQRVGSSSYFGFSYKSSWAFFSKDQIQNQIFFAGRPV